MSAEEKKYTIFQVGINLAAACLISGLIIAAVYFVTAPIASKNAIAQQQKAMQDLVRDADEFVEVEGQEEWLAAEKDGEVIAYVIETESQGYAGPIRLLVAVTPDAKVIDFSILAANETPGLGSNAGDEAFRKQFWDKGLDGLQVVKEPTKDKIQAMTGATITSRAVTNGIIEAVEAVESYVGGK